MVPLRPSGVVRGGQIWSPRNGYDLAAKDYDQWYWRSFWIANEEPIFKEWLVPTSLGKRALDIGTGTGHYLNQFMRSGYQVTGLDISLQMLNVASRTRKDSALVCGALAKCPFRSASFDRFSICRVLSHVLDLETAFREIGRVAKVGAELFFSDLSASHHYARTRIPTASGDVHIQTFKHALSDVVLAADKSRLWTTRSLADVRVSDLRFRPDENEFPSIDWDSNESLFFHGVLRRGP